MLNDATVINTVIVFRRCGYRVKNKKLMTLRCTHFETNSRQLCGTVQLGGGGGGFQDFGASGGFIAQKQLNGQRASERERFRLFFQVCSTSAVHITKKDGNRVGGKKYLDKLFHIKR